MKEFLSPGLVSKKDRLAPVGAMKDLGLFSAGGGEAGLSGGLGAMNDLGFFSAGGGEAGLSGGAMNDLGFFSAGDGEVGLSGGFTGVFDSSGGMATGSPPILYPTKDLLAVAGAAGLGEG